MPAPLGESSRNQRPARQPKKHQMRQVSSTNHGSGDAHYSATQPSPPSTSTNSPRKDVQQQCATDHNGQQWTVPRRLFSGEGDSEYGSAQNQSQNNQNQNQSDRDCVIDSRKYKTKLCRNWSSAVTCPYGDRCVFAHGGEDLRRMEDPNPFESVFGNQNSTRRRQSGGKTRSNGSQSRNSGSASSQSQQAAPVPPPPPPPPPPGPPPPLRPEEQELLVTTTGYDASGARTTTTVITIPQPVQQQPVQQQMQMQPMQQMQMQPMQQMQIVPRQHMLQQQLIAAPIAVEAGRAMQPQQHGLRSDAAAFVPPHLDSMHVTGMPCPSSPPKVASRPSPCCTPLAQHLYPMEEISMSPVMAAEPVPEVAESMPLLDRMSTITPLKEGLFMHEQETATPPQTPSTYRYDPYADPATPDSNYIRVVNLGGYETRMDDSPEVTPPRGESSSEQ